MTASKPKKMEAAKSIRSYLTIGDSENGNLTATHDEHFSFEALLGTKTKDAALSIMLSAMNALGANGKNYRPLASSIFAELEPQDAVEAMLIAQMVATHTLMTGLAGRVADQTHAQIRESQERSMTRLSRTYLAQMEALKKYRAKAQQVVRVERVTVNEGGQAIVGDVTHGERPADQK